MRIGIDFRFLAGGPNVFNRGMGRYSQQQLREVLKLDQTNEYYLLCPPGCDLSLTLPEIRRAPNVQVIEAPPAPLDPQRVDDLLRRTEAYQQLLFQHHLTVYHATTTFAWYDTVLPHFDVCPLVSTFYDPIPYIFPARYLETLEEAVLSAFGCLRKSTRLLAISEASRADAINYAGFPAARIDVAYPIADPHFKRLTPAEIRAQLQTLEARLPVRLPETFVLTVTHLHYTKNLETLLRAYSLLSKAFRKQFPLLVVCNLSEVERRQVRALADAYALEESVVITGFVSEPELVALYNRATVVAHPAWYEGFGLPVLEAMWCGTPVITSSVAAMPEVAGPGGMLVDPNDSQGLAAAIETICSEPDLRARLSAAGYQQAQRFTPELLGQNTLACYQRAAQPAVAATPRPRLALWTVLPPQPSGIADYSAELLPHLAKFYDLEVFVDDGYLPQRDLLYRYSINHYSAYARRKAQAGFDAQVYQLGNSHFHMFTYDQLKRESGLVMVHDLVWSLAPHGKFMREGREDEFKRLLLSQEGEAALKEYEQLRKLPAAQGHSQTMAFLRRHYMLGEITEASRALAVQSDMERADVCAQYHPPPVHIIPMGVEDPYKQYTLADGLALRRENGVGARTFVAGVFGIVAPIKRLEVCLQAFARLKQQLPDSQLWIVGPTDDTEYFQLLKRLARTLKIQDHVEFLGRVDQASFARLMLACDVVVNLRYPSMKQLSAIILRALAAGKPMLLSDIPEWQFVPAEIARHVLPGETEVDKLAESLVELGTQPVVRHKMGQAARQYYERHGRVEQMAECYRTVIDTVYGLQRGMVGPSAETAASADWSLSRVCNAEDFARADFRQQALAIAEFYPAGRGGTEMYDGRLWLSTLLVMALKKYAHLHREASILVVGAGHHPLVYYLTNQVKQVFAVDRYWPDDDFKDTMLFAPARLAARAYDAQRLVVQSMSLPILDYPDNFFDAVIVGEAFNRLGSVETLANLAYELGRVVKPGGGVYLGGDYFIAGPPGGQGWSKQWPIFTPADINRYVVAASGLQLEPAFVESVSNMTLAWPRPPILRASNFHPEDYSVAQLITVVEGYVFGTFHVALNKVATCAQTNQWARPADDLRYLQAVQALSAWTREGDRGRAAGLPNSAALDGVERAAPARPRRWSGGPSRGMLKVLRLVLNESHLIGLRRQYGRMLKLLPAPLAVFLHKCAYRVGFIERL